MMKLTFRKNQCSTEVQGEGTKAKEKVQPFGHEEVMGVP